MDLAYARALAASVPMADLAAGVTRRLTRTVKRLTSREPVHGSAPAPPAPLRLGLFATANAAELQAGYRVVGERALDLARVAADEAARGQVRTVEALPLPVGAAAYLMDPLSGRAWTGKQPPLMLDPRAVWEAGKLSHVTALAVGTRLFPDRSRCYLAAAVEHLSDFRTAVRDPDAAQQRSPLELALRIIQLACAWDLAGAHEAWPREGPRLVAQLIADHARALAADIEDGGLVVGTHTLGDLLGLLFARAAGCGGVTGSGRLFTRLHACAARQVAADGTHLEGSTAYHRFALELVLWAWLLARAVHATETPALERLLRRMLLAQRDLTIAAGRLDAGIGDSDDARVVTLARRGVRERGYLLALGAALLREPALRAPGLPLCEEAILLCGVRAITEYAALAEQGAPRARSFPAAGFHGLRLGDGELILRAGPHGQRGVGGHAHNDQLSVVWHHLRGGDIVIDPGTFAYAGAPAHRDRLRSTGVHATLAVDEMEQSPLPDRLFALPDRAGGRVVLFDPGRRVVVAEHRGYSRLPGRVVHRRRVELLAGGAALRIRDRLLGAGVHRLTLRVPLAPDWSVDAAVEGESDGDAARAWPASTPRVDLVKDGARLSIEARTSFDSSELLIEVHPAWYAPAYGVRAPLMMLSLAARASLPCTLELLLYLTL
jgi:hypothetical protein